MVVAELEDAMSQPTWADTGQREYRRILTYAGMIILVSWVANSMLGIRASWPMIVPLWGISVAGFFLYLLARYERIPDSSRLASHAVPLTAPFTMPTTPSRPAALSGTVTSGALISDIPYHQGGNFLALTRITEVLRREQHTQRDRLEWHEESQHTVYASQAQIGELTFTPDESVLVGMPRHRIAPSPIAAQLSEATSDERYLYIPGQAGARLGVGTLVRGDRRIAHYAVPSNVPATLFGVPEHGEMVPFVAADGQVIHSLWAGSLPEALATLRTQEATARRNTRLVVGVMEIIAWTVLCADFKVGTLVEWGAYTAVVLGSIIGIASVVLVSTVVNPRQRV